MSDANVVKEDEKENVALAGNANLFVAIPDTHDDLVDMYRDEEMNKIGLAAFINKKGQEMWLAFLTSTIMDEAKSRCSDVLPSSGRDIIPEVPKIARETAWRLIESFRNENNERSAQAVWEEFCVLIEVFEDMGKPESVDLKKSFWCRCCCWKK
ncbi:hypothetical protein ACFLY6_00670 [Candidatus Dependentiae bacterium]